MLRGRKKAVNPVKNPDYPGVVPVFWLSDATEMLQL